MKKNSCASLFCLRRFFEAGTLAVFCAGAFGAPAGMQEAAPWELSGFVSDPFEVEPLRERFLARNGRVFGKIFLSTKETHDGEIAAAFDLAEWLKRVANSDEIPIETEAENPQSLAEISTGIYVGNTVAAEKLGIFAPAGEGETYVIETRGNAVFIVGKTPTATRIAVGEFLREALGIEFVWPGFDGAEWEVLSEIPFPRLRIAHVPAFPWRLIGTRDSDWNIHLGFGDLPRFSHNIGNVFTRDVYEKHPELAPQVLDKKFTDFTGYYAPQPNLTLPAAVDVTLDAAKAFFEKNPDAPMFALGINDSTNWDESESSEIAYGALSYFRNLPDRSNYFYDFVNRAADAVRDFNGKSVGVIAYMDVQNTPKFPMRENVVPVLCADRSMWIFPEFKAEDKALMRRWARSGVNTWGVYDYYYGNPFLFPRLFFKEQAEAIKFVYENGGKIFYAECGAVVPFDAPKVWLAAQLFRDPTANPDKILSDYYEKTFGPAAGAMQDFYDFCCRVWKNQGGQSRWIKAWNNENGIEIFSREKLAIARTYLDAAFAALPGKSDGNASPRERRIRARLSEISAALSRAEKFAESYFARKSLDAAKMTSFEETLAALKNPAWRYEEIYDDVAFAGLKHRANISEYGISDPRPAAMLRVLDFLEKTESEEQKSAVERAFRRIFGNAQRFRAEISDAGMPEKPLSQTDARLKLMAECVPALSAHPDFLDDFEPESFETYSPGDWRAGKNLQCSRAWNCILAASEKLEMGPSAENPYRGETALRIAGEAERAELSKTVRIAPGKKVLAQVMACGTVSCGSVSYLAIEFFDEKRKTIARTVASLPVGETKNWRKLVALAEAPERSRFVRICLYVGLQGPGDVSFFDDLTASVF